MTNQRKLKALLILALLKLITACEPKATDEKVSSAGNVAPSPHTIKHNREVLNQLPFSDTKDFEEAEKGLVIAAENLVVHHAKTEDIIWNMPAYDFIAGEAPASVNPSLWRQAKLNSKTGLYKVKEGIWQLRGFDLATISIIEGNKGWIIVDPNTSIETGEVSRGFLQEHLLRDKPISTIIFTHSHIDHFGGVAAYVTNEQVQSGEVTIVAPEHFVEEAVSENVMLGSAMSRRAGYQYGVSLQPGPRGSVDLGLGKSVPFGTNSLLIPNLIVKKTGETHTLDGVEFVFQIASGTEAPAELTFYLPEHKAFCGAEVISRTMHNVYTLRGAKVRDALLWSSIIDDMLQNYGHSDVVFNSHHWPIWGQERVRRYLETQRDTYKYIHDQTVRMILQGMTPNEIANTITLPETLNNQFYSRGYYGTLQHNAKAVYQFYMGWYDSNPANLHSLDNHETAPKYIELMGGIDSVVAKAQSYYENGEYQWVAELLNHAVFADPNHWNAKQLLAKTYDQMAYQAESGTWRSEYLSAAHELRHGITAPNINVADSAEVLTHTPIPKFLETLAVSVEPEKAAGKDLNIELAFTDIDQIYLLSLRNSVLNFYQLPNSNLDSSEPSATLRLTKRIFLELISGQSDLKTILFSDELSTEGSRRDLLRFFTSFSTNTSNFPIVVP